MALRRGTLTIYSRLYHNTKKDDVSDTSSFSVIRIPFYLIILCVAFPTRTIYVTFARFETKRPSTFDLISIPLTVNTSTLIESFSIESSKEVPDIWHSALIPEPSTASAVMTAVYFFHSLFNSTLTFDSPSD